MYGKAEQGKLNPLLKGTYMWVLWHKSSCIPSASLFFSPQLQTGEHQRSWLYAQPGELFVLKSSFPEQAAKTSQVLYEVKS